VAASLQGLYHRVFGLESRTTRDAPRALIWLVLLVAWLFASGLVGPRVRAGGPVVFAIVGLVVFTLFWWFTMWLLLAGRIPWRRLLPCAIATGVFWLAMEAVFTVTFSGMVTSDYREYGPIGTVFALMSYLIAIGVVVILGAVTGLVWQERGLSFWSALRQLRPNRKLADPQGAATADRAHNGRGRAHYSSEWGRARHHVLRRSAAGPHG
jgi:membrane protein